MNDCDMRNRGATSTGMTFQLLHLFLLIIFIIQNKVILGLLLVLNVFLYIFTWQILKISRELFISRFYFVQNTSHFI